MDSAVLSARSAERMLYRLVLAVLSIMVLLLWPALLRSMPDTSSRSLPSACVTPMAMSAESRGFISVISSTSWGRLAVTIIRLSLARSVAPLFVPLMQYLIGSPHSDAPVYSVVDFDAPGLPDMFTTTP